jgi:hypothetical protein
MVVTFLSVVMELELFSNKQHHNLNTLTDTFMHIFSVIHNTTGCDIVSCFMCVFFASWCLVDTLSVTWYSDLYTCDKVLHREHYNAVIIL